jgi:23S rRNA (pseudouridine1915-N3)-methyltransferase
MKIKIIQVGKIKDRYLQDGINEMIKRLQMFCGVEISTLTDNTKKGTPKEKIIAEESLKVSSMIPKNSLVVVLDEKGKEFTSVEFSKVLSSAKDRGETLVFVIGGPFGLSENLKRNAGVLLSLSKMTFTHQMIRLFLLEQIYRGFCILSGKEYHY